MLLAAVLMAACKTPIEPDFTFSPEMPKAGERVTFTNLTEEGEYWNWTYGDGGKSTAKNPTYVYRQPGIYDVTLMVDSNKNYVRTKKITIYDTIPSIYIDREEVRYYETCNFSVLVYNPYSYDVSYEWTFSSNAHSEKITDRKSTEKSLSVYYSHKNTMDTVSLIITVGNKIDTISKIFYIEDVPARSLLMAQKDGKVLRQRIFEKGLEPFTETNIESGKHPFYIRALSNKLYLFDAGTHVSAVRDNLNGKAGDGNIRKIDMVSETGTEIIHNRNVGAEHGFYNGYVDGSDIYWTDFSEFVYKIPDDGTVHGAFNWQGDADAQTSVPYYMVKSDRLGYFGNGLEKNQLSAGFYVYDHVFFWAKGGSGKGIYRFAGSDILSQNVSGSGIPPQSGSILNRFSIRAFQVDHVNQKIYFSATAPADSTGFWVANISGTNAVRIDDSPVGNPVEYITGIVVDHVTNRVYWAYRAPDDLNESYFNSNPTHRTGVKFVRLAKNISVDKNIGYFALGVAAYGITIDEVLK